MDKVQLPKVKEETRIKINMFKDAQKLNNLDKKVKTFEDAILIAINEAVKVPALEARIRELERENHVMQELREVIIPIPREVLNSTPEEIDSLDLSGLELENRLKTCWKKFANFKGGE